MPRDRLNYETYKAHGLCPRCYEPAGVRVRDGKPRTYCAKCIATIGRYAKPGANAAAQAKMRAKRCRAGLCADCGKGEREIGRGGRLTKHCWDCMQRKAARRRLHRAPVVTRVVHCSMCGGARHLAPSCPRVVEALPLRIEEFAAARREAA